MENQYKTNTKSDKMGIETSSFSFLYKHYFGHPLAYQTGFLRHLEVLEFWDFSFSALDSLKT